MAKRQILNIAANNEHLRNEPIPTKVEEKPKKSKQRTSMVFDTEQYEYIKRLRLNLSAARGKQMTIDETFSEIVSFYIERH